MFARARTSGDSRTSGRRTRAASRADLIAALAVLLAAACAPSVQGPSQSSSQSGPPPGAATTLQIGSNSEKKAGILYQSYVQADVDLVFHSSLTLYDPQGNLIPRLAQKVPTVSDGDWVVRPDGRMEVTWRIRPGVKWHDGTPLSVDDFLLGFKIRLDKEIPIAGPPWAGVVADIQRVDDSAFTVVWKEPYFLANQAGPVDFVPLPQHVLGTKYADTASKATFINEAYWTREFMGLGPYKMGEWMLGSTTEGVAFDDYFLGRPKIDKITFRYYGDLGAMTASLLSGAIDVIPVGALHPEEGETIMQTWGPTKGGTILVGNYGIAVLFPQFRDTNAPWVRDLRVRKAMAHVIDAQNLSDAFGYGLTKVAYTLPTPDDPLYRLVEARGLTKYPYDPRQADQLLAQSGWSKNRDGKYQDSTGKILTIEGRTVAVTPGSFQRVLAVSDQFKAFGFESPSTPIPSTGADPSARAKTEGVFVHALPDSPTSMNTFITSLVQTEANGWRGANTWGYSNPVFDDLYHRYSVTLEPGTRQGLRADMLKLASDELMFVPMFYDPQAAVMAVRSGVRGPATVRASQQAEIAWNIHTWEMD